jgi:VWFA-related protein
MTSPYAATDTTSNPQEANVADCGKRRQIRFLLSALAAWSGIAAPATSQAPTPTPAQPPVFGTSAELVWLDVIVLDGEGMPVSGLAREDFSVEDGGRPQEVTSFESVAVQERPVAPAAEPPRMSTARLRAPAEGRTLYVFFDDIHLTPPSSEYVRVALRRFIQRETRDGDWITLMAPQQGLWWTARNSWEYAQLLAVVDRLQGQYVRDPGTQFAMSGLSDFQAICIVQGLPGDMCNVGAANVPPAARGAGGAARAEGALGPGGGGRGSGESASPGGGERIMTVGSSNVEFLAEEVNARARRRIEMTLAGLRSALESLVTMRGHKALLLVSEGFVLVPDMPGYQELVDSARRANVAVHFLDPRALQSGYNGEDQPPGLGWATRQLFDSAGADDLAGATGGRTFIGNDPTIGMAQVAAESQSYYLLGYAPTDTKAGERKVKVRVTRPGLTVRSRTRYYIDAPRSAEAKVSESGKEDSRSETLSQRAMSSLADTTDLPLRATTYHFEPGSDGKVVTMLAVELLPPPGPKGTRSFNLAFEARARDGGPPVGDRMEGSWSVEPGKPLVLARQWSLAPGTWQLRLLAEDVETKRIGTLVHTFEVPDAKGFRLSTPLVTDELQDPNGSRRPKIALERSFRPGGVLYCQYSVYGATASKPASRVLGSWVLRRELEIVRESAPSPIQPAGDGRLTRTLGINLEGATPGEYALVLNVRDEQTGRTATRTEPFSVVQ